MKRALFSALTVAVLVGAPCATAGAAVQDEPCENAAKLGKDLAKLIDKAPEKGAVIDLVAGCTYTMPAPKGAENGVDPQKGKRGSAIVIIKKEITINGNGAVLKCENQCNILRADSAEVTIKDVTFTGSVEAAIAVPFGNLTLEGVTVVGNYGNGGGGMVLGAGVVTLDNTRVEYNMTSDGGGGGGIAMVAGTLNLKNKSSVSHNTAMSETLTIAGGIFNVGGKVTIEDSTGNGNTAGNGAGIFATMDGTVDVRRSTISGNTALGDAAHPDFPAGGGITAERNTKVTIEESTMADNKPSNCLVVPQEGATTAITGCPA